MKTTDLYSTPTECCGCELCSAKCPKNIIEMNPDPEGFIYPVIVNEESCINCGKCLNVCPLKKSDYSYEVLEISGGYNNNINDVRKSSSGGIATLISEYFIKKMSGVVYGVAYGNNCTDIIYKRASSVSELEQFRTSKYAQARKYNIYNDIFDDLKAGNNVLVIGLPCDIIAVYNSLGKYTEKLYTISLICHGPTSPKVHKEYCENLIHKYKSSIKNFSVRYKKTGWKPYYIYAEFQNNDIFYEKFATSVYDIAFKYLKRPSCYSCQFKLGSNHHGIKADIILGDYHAVQKDEKCYNSWGTSEILILSNKGRSLLDCIKASATIEKISNRNLSNGNIALYSNIPASVGCSIFAKKFITSGLKKASNIPSIYLCEKKKYWTKVLKSNITGLLNVLKIR